VLVAGSAVRFSSLLYIYIGLHDIESTEGSSVSRGHYSHFKPLRTPPKKYQMRVSKRFGYSAPDGLIICGSVVVCDKSSMK
jgi:hypothetical protein